MNNCRTASTYLVALFLAWTMGTAGCAPSTPAQKLDLSEAVSEGFVEIKASGRGLEFVEVSLESKSADPLEVTIPVGLIFEAHTAGTQNMVVRKETVVTLRGRGNTESLRIDTPGESDTFSVSERPPPEDLKKLLKLRQLNAESFRVQQFAIWTITDNPTRNGYVGFGQFGFGSGPNDDEIQRIRRLLESAGIPPENYRALK